LTVNPFVFFLCVGVVLYVISSFFIYLTEQDKKKRDREWAEAETTAQTIQQILDRHEQEQQIRQNYPAVANAYDQYQLMLKMVENNNEM